MKYLLLLLTTTLLISCSTNKNVNTTNIDGVKYEIVEEKIILTDTFILPTYHEHIKMGSKYFCMIFDEYKYEVTDTLYIENLVPLK